MLSLKPVAPLLMSAGLLFAGNGIVTTLLTLRANYEGFDTFTIGLISTAYFFGFIVAAISAPQMIRTVGYIRTFAAMAALCTAIVLLLILWINPYTWMILRFVMGFATSALFLSVESWLNNTVGNSDRGRLFGVYRVIDLSAVLISQLLLNLFPVDGFKIFILSAIFFSLSIIPLSLSPRAGQTPPVKAKFKLIDVYRISPLAFSSCIAIGMTNSIFRGLGPLFAEDVGMSIFGISLFMALGILGGTLTQYPLGSLSDRLDRRRVMLFTTLGATSIAGCLSLFSSYGMLYALIGIFIFGGLSLPLYSLAQALANDRADSSMRLAVGGALLITYSIGAALGPLPAGLIADLYGADKIFYFAGFVHGLFAIVSLWRLFARASVPPSEQSTSVPLSRTSSALNTMVPDSKTKKQDDQ